MFSQVEHLINYAFDREKRKSMEHEKLCLIFPFRRLLLPRSRPPPPRFSPAKMKVFFCEKKKGSLNFARLDTWLFEKFTRGHAYAQNLETLLCYSSTFILIVRIDFKAFLEALVPPQHLSSIKAFLKSNKNAHFFL